MSENIKIITNKCAGNSRTSSVDRSYSRSQFQY